VRVLVNPLGLVAWPSDGVLWRSWAVAAIGNGGDGDMAVGTGVMEGGGD
jgi:hypothetical protein